MPKSLNDVLKMNMAFAAQYDGAYYFYPKTDDHYDHCMWKVDMSTGEVSYFDLIEFLEFEDKATLIDPDTLRRAS